MKSMIVLPESNVYHERNCWHLKHSQKKCWLYTNPEKAEQRGLRPCKCCSTVRFHLTYERKALDRFVSGKSMTYKIIGDSMYVKTDISCWKIIYDPSKLDYVIFHRNKSSAPIDFDHPEREHYHRQKDKQGAPTMEACFRYIRSHDSFRKSEQLAGGDLKRMNISPRYQKQVQNRRKRQERRRLDAIFAALEQQNPEYKTLAFC